MKLYLSGPMTGLPNLNYPTFNLASLHLRQDGHQVYNPADWEAIYGAGVFNLKIAFGDFCYYICREADAVVTLPGWENSPGATAEVSLAKAIKLPVYNLDSILVRPLNLDHPTLFEKDKT